MTKIPPHIARELKRHVQNGAKSGASSTGKKDNSKTIKTLLGCTAFIGFTASFPYLGMAWIGPLNDRDEALTHAQIRRGAFNNSGSRDAGKDPHWDFKTGTRIKDESYTELFLKDNPNQIDHGDKFFRGATNRRN
ncbi:hypothetical protein CTEN210_06185 [Chaetoceros tenuissimus]|uniref:Uncharacterized protein n=1 Tax=Chaetoceros tenuissimus TaxID=426638 RepID=A0AAD3CS52_9STRA|nr:hypothetical protein CTEN210_06185 [Chaetoceros tenuissimus]